MALPSDLVTMHLHTVKDAVSRGAVCNDGSPAKYYFRDCPRPASECAGWSADWLVLFAGGDSSDACYDDASCTARQLNTPDKMSSTKFNATLSPKGIFSTSGEENPNFYGFRTVFVPYCSSDLWLGNRIEASTLSFRGRAIVVAVLEDLKATTFSPTAIPTSPRSASATPSTRSATFWRASPRPRPGARRPLC